MGGEGSEAALAGARNVPATCLELHARRASRIITQIDDAALEPAALALNKFSLLVATHLLTGRIRLRGIWFVGRKPPIW